MTGDLLSADVFPAHQAQMVAEMRPQLLRPRGAGRRLPGWRRLHVGRFEVVERDVFAVGAGRPETPRHDDARYRGELRDVLGVVPFVEFGLDLRRAVHRIE